MVTVLAEDINGQALPGNWHERWLDAMHAHHWRVSWRIAPGAGFERQFAPYPRQESAGVVLLGEHTDRPGARAADYLTGVTTDLPVASPAVPYVPGTDGSSPVEREAYSRLAAALFRWPGSLHRRPALKDQRQGARSGVRRPGSGGEWWCSTTWSGVSSGTATPPQSADAPDRHGLGVGDGHAPVEVAVVGEHEQRSTGGRRPPSCR